MWLGRGKSLEDPTAQAKRQLLIEGDFHPVFGSATEQTCALINSWWPFLWDRFKQPPTFLQPAPCFHFPVHPTILCIPEARLLWKETGPSLAWPEPHLVLGGSRGNAFINNHSLLPNRLCSGLCCQDPVGRDHGPYLRAAGSCWERGVDH